MRRILPLLLLGLAASGGPIPAAETAPADLARRALEASSRAYRSAPALSDTMTYVVRGPNMDREPKKIEIRLGAGSDASVADALLAATSVGRTFYLTKSDAPGKYVARPFSGDFGAALRDVAGSQSSLFEPVQVALREGRSVDACLDALRFNLLGPLRIAAFTRGTGSDGAPTEDIGLEADNGRETLRLDARTHFVSSVRLSVTPPGAPTGVSVEIEASFAPKVVRAAAGFVAFDAGARRAVPSVADLTSETLPIGKPAPAFSLETPSGRRVTLADLRGRAVLIDFWATWCVPCWKTLKETQQLVDWAAKSPRPVSVLAINTMEQFPSEAERRSRVEAFFRSQGFTMPTLLDDGTSVFRAFGAPGLPSMVVIAPDGTILAYHEGLFPNAAETLKAELTKAAAKSPAPAQKPAS